MFFIVHSSIQDLDPDISPADLLTLQCLIITYSVHLKSDKTFLAGIIHQVGHCSWPGWWPSARASGFSMQWPKPCCSPLPCCSISRWHATPRPPVHSSVLLCRPHCGTGSATATFSWVRACLFSSLQLPYLRCTLNRLLSRSIGTRGQAITLYSRPPIGYHKNIFILIDYDI